MKKGKYQHCSRFKGGKTIAALLLVVLLIGTTIGGTLAWLTDTTKEVNNTFTIGNINISLTETPNKDTDDDDTPDIWQGKMIPGDLLDKDPKVTVEAGSEACWLFVEVKESGSVTVDKTTYDFQDFISYDIRPDWKPLDGESGVYYRKVSAADAEQGISYYLLTCKEDPADKDCNGCVSVNTTVTKPMMDALEKAGTGSYPKLTFTAYAIQQANIGSSTNGDAANAAAAWDELHP